MAHFNDYLECWTGLKSRTLDTRALALETTSLFHLIWIFQNSSLIHYFVLQVHLRVMIYKAPNSSNEVFRFEFSEFIPFQKGKKNHKSLESV